MTDSDALVPLHPSVVIIWRITGMITTVVLTAAIGVLEWTILAPNAIAFVTPWFITGATAAVAFVFSITWPGLAYRFWRWQVQADRVLIHKGVLWRSRSLIPRVRIQHVDTRTSPLQRWLGLASLVIYTAGTRGADAEIPGLEAEEAELLREELARLEELDDRA
jgi:membrane protein YdbS with pleckstrin-like domain